VAALIASASTATAQTLGSGCANSTRSPVLMAIADDTYGHVRGNEHVASAKRRGGRIRDILEVRTCGQHQ
jgi:hypothetical protein